MKRVILSAVVLLAALSTSAQTIYRPQPKEWKYLAEGGEFQDRILPMWNGEKATSEDWGGENVSQRFIDNGIERDDISFWGASIIADDNGKYHMFTCGWQENNPKGHFGWKESRIYHATCDNPVGPFKVIEEMGPGHNPEVVKLEDGTFMVYHVTHLGDKWDISTNLRYYLTSDLNSGEWETKIMKLDLRDREIKLGGGTWFHNMSFAKRDDGSILMLSRNGSIWVSETGTTPYHLLTTRSVYPMVDGRYEDPVIWRDNIQYHLIVNDWMGRVAFYMRSKEGVNWVADPGTAYTPGVSVHEDGYVEDWYKYERIRMRQDEHKRAIQANFAVVDSSKADDQPLDNHSSKNIAVPLNPGMLLEMVDKAPITYKTKLIAVKIFAEEGFNPQTDLDIESMRFGANSEVNFGRGAEVKETKCDGKDLIIYFGGKGHCITEAEFAPKMLGKKKNGEMVYGYVRLPWLSYQEEMLSARKPEWKGKKIEVEVGNYAQTTSCETILTLGVYDENGVEREVASIAVPAIKPYENVKLKLSPNIKMSKGEEEQPVIVRILNRHIAPTTFITTL